MSYFRDRIRTLKNEYAKGNRASILKAAPSRCPFSNCGRRVGDEYIFGPTKYLKKRIRFKVEMHIHSIEGETLGPKYLVMCSGCHMSYHHFNRLSEDAEMGGKQLKKGVYKRCRRCNDMYTLDARGRRTCDCCPKCNRAPKWCACGKRKKR